jgi:CO/xanthine dehydrogenase Mo-binding subunit
MGKKDKTEAKPEKTKPTPPPQPPKPKYGVPELAEALGVKPSSVRVRLRNAGIEKSGKLYGWDSKAEMQEVINKLNASKKAKAKDEEDDEE